MIDSLTDPKSRTTQSNAFSPVVLFVLAAAVLMLMSAWEPRLGLPLVAFLAMAFATRLLGKRLYHDLTGAPEATD